MACNDVSLFKERRCNNGSTIKLANGNHISASKIGTISFKSELNEELNDVVVNDVLVADDLKHNLLSVSKLTEVGAEVTFNSDAAIVKRNDEVIFKATKVDGLYVVKTGLHESSLVSTEETNKKYRVWKGGNIDLWHRRLGHVSEDVLKKTLPLTGSMKPCESCWKGKFDRKPFDDVGYREEALLQRVYSDVCGPLEVESCSGAKYFVTFIDGYSRKKPGAWYQVYQRVDIQSEDTRIIITKRCLFFENSVQ